MNHLNSLLRLLIVGFSTLNIVPLREAILLVIYALFDRLFDFKQVDRGLI
jgi:hypothetical protein